MTRFEEYCNRQRRLYGERFRPPADARFRRYYESGERIKVRTCGMVLTGTVALTTGWKPSFLLMRTRRSAGSPWLMGERDEVLAVKRGKQYVEVGR